MTIKEIPADAVETRWNYNLDIREVRYLVQGIWTEWYDQDEKDTRPGATPSTGIESPMWVPPATEHEANILGAQVANFIASADQLPADMVTLPAHYARFKIEPIRFCIENNLNSFQFNIIKYVLRWDAKNGLEDLEKGMRYLVMFIEWVKGNPDWWRKPA